MDPMNILVLSGGGSHGAFQVGVLKYLMTHEDGPWYRAFCGVSVGSINATFLAQYTTRNSIQGLVDLWENLSDDKVKKRWFPFGKLHALWEKGMYDTSPLRETLTTYFDHQKLLNTGNKLRIGAVNISTLEYKIFTEEHPDIVSVMMGSSAFPLVLPASEIDGDYYVDGGVRTVAPILAAMNIPGVKRIDIILADKRVDKHNKPAPKNTLDVGKASLEAAMSEIFHNDILIAILKNEAEHSNIEFRIFEPKECLSQDPMNFDHDPVMEMISIGYETAKDQL